MTVANEEFVRYALTIGAISLVPEERGELKSKRISPYFFNSGLFNTGESLSKLAEYYASAVRNPSCTDVIFGSADKGIPIAVAVTTVMWNNYSANMGFAFNRKEEKTHGEKGILVGHPLAGKTVCIVDDVITTGKTLAKAVQIIRANGGIPISCVIAFDRQERGIDGELSAVQEFQRNYKIPVHSVATLAVLIAVLEKDVQSKTPTIPNGNDILKKILLYRDKYGAM